MLSGSVFKIVQPKVKNNSCFFQ